MIHKIALILISGFLLLTMMEQAAQKNPTPKTPQELSQAEQKQTAADKAVYLDFSNETNHEVEVSVEYLRPTGTWFLDTAIITPGKTTSLPYKGNPDLQLAGVTVKEKNSKFNDVRLIFWDPAQIQLILKNPSWHPYFQIIENPQSLAINAFFTPDELSKAIQKKLAQDPQRPRYKKRDLNF